MFSKLSLTLTLHLADPEAWLKISFAPGWAWSFTVRITGERSLVFGHDNDNENDNENDDD